MKSAIDKSSYTILSTLDIDELNEGLKKCLMPWWRIYDSRGERIAFSGKFHAGEWILTPRGESRNFARKQHLLKFERVENGTNISVRLQNDPGVTLFFLIWWCGFIMFAVSALRAGNWFVLAALAGIGFFMVILLLFARKSAKEELPEVKQALRVLIAGIEAEYEK